MELSNNLSQYSFFSLRKHFFKDRKYIVNIEGTILLIYEPNRKNHPKYSLSLSLSTIVHWQTQQGSKNNLTLTGFGLTLKNKFKWFNASEKDLLNFKNILMPIVTFQNLNTFYKPLKEIGSGGFSKVFLAESFLDKKIYAIKRIQPQGNELILENDDVKREINYFKKCQGPHFAKIYEIFCSENNCFIVMEYISNGNLNQFNLKNVLLTNFQCEKIIKELLEGLIFIHHQGIVHRDIKPDNIMLTNDLEVKIIDFGLACEINNRPIKYEVIGTPGYIAPESFKLEKKENIYTEKTDIFSVGCVFYQMLTGVQLFKGQTQFQKLKNNQKCDIDLEFLLIPEPERGLLTQLLKINPLERVNALQALQDPYFHKKSNLFEIRSKENTRTFSQSVDSRYEISKKSNEELVPPSECLPQKIPLQNPTFLLIKKV